MTNPLSLNLYTYVGNNPLGYIDPSGHDRIGFMPDFSWATDWLFRDRTDETKQAAKYVLVGGYEVAKFLVVDDVMTIIDPSSSSFDRTLALAGFIPVGKVVKGGKLIVRLASDGKTIERSVEATDDAIRAAAKLSNKDLKHILNNHHASTFAKQVDYLPDDVLNNVLNSKSFFNPNWSVEQVTEGVEQAYAAALKDGVSNSAYSYTYLGEEITVFINKDGNLSTAYGDHVLSASDLGR